jgi:NADPH2 dehydrogenase
MREKNPVPTFSYIIEQLRDHFPQLAYLHLIEPGVQGNADTPAGAEESNDFARKVWGERPLIAAGGFTAESAKATVEQKGGLIAFGRHFISNVCILLVTDLHGC